MQEKTSSTKTLPSEGFVRLSQVLKVIPVSRTQFLRCVRKGAFPKPVKLSTRTTAWRVEDIRELITKLAKGHD